MSKQINSNTAVPAVLENKGQNSVNNTPVATENPELNLTVNATVVNDAPVVTENPDLQNVIYGNFNLLESEKNEDLVEIIFILSPAGKYKLPYNVGQTVLINRNQANVIVEAGYAKFLTDESSEKDSE